MSPKQGDKVYEAYFSAFPGLNKFFEESKAISLKRGYVLIDNITKRKFYFKDLQQMYACEHKGDYKRASKLKGAMERAALNYQIQGEAGSITKYATVLLREWLLENNLEKEIKIVLLVHDEINLESSIEYQDIAAKELERCMEKAGNLWCKRVPLKATSVISEYWQH